MNKKASNFRYKIPTRDQRSSINLGQPHELVMKSWYISNPIFNKLIDFVQKNQSYDFDTIYDFRWANLARFPIDEVMIAAKTTCKKEYREGLHKCLKNLKMWSEKKGKKTPFSEEVKARNKNMFQDVMAEEIKKEKNRLNQMTSIAFKNKHHSSLLRILKNSNDPEASEMLEYINKYLIKDTKTIEEPAPFIDWKEVEAGYSITINSTINPFVKVVQRWDAIVHGYKLSLVRKNAIISMSNEFAVFVDLDTNGLEIISSIGSPLNVNSHVNNFFKNNGIDEISNNKLTNKK